MGAYQPNRRVPVAILRCSGVHSSAGGRGPGRGEIAAKQRPLAFSNAQIHPSFVYRPETGEEAYHALMGVRSTAAGKSSACCSCGSPADSALRALSAPSEASWSIPSENRVG